ncbi:MAG: glycosyltransferase [Weeksellaceae bacterium]|nr:glycosyltransferase [Bacteroidota bacterium]MCG2779522.1 glycosyltransferase [Weeksellaceae bacterium]
MKTSVAICTFNGEKFLKEQLESIIAQTVPVDEIIVCDDRSTDQTWKIIMDYQSKYPRIFKICRNENSLGVIKNFEKAINLCQNEIIFLCDQDDLWKPNKVETVLRYFKNNPGKEAVFHDLELLENDSILQFSNWESIFFQPENTDGISIQHYLVLFGNIATGASFAFRNPKKQWIFNPSSTFLLHDYQLALHFAAANTLGFIDEKLGVYRLHDNQQVGTDQNNRHRRKEIYDTFVNSNNLQKLKYYEAKSKYWKGKLNADDRKKIIHFIAKEMDILKRKHLQSLTLIQRNYTALYWAVTNKFQTKT